MMMYPDEITIIDETTTETTTQTPTGGWETDTSVEAEQIYTGYADVVEDAFGQTLKGIVADEGDAMAYLNSMDSNLDPHALQSGQKLEAQHHNYRIKKVDPFSMVLLMAKEDDDN